MTATTGDTRFLRPGGEPSPSIALPILLGGGAVVLGLLAGQLVVSGKAMIVFALAAVGLPFLLWRRPYLGPIVLISAALSIEQFPYAVGVGKGVGTDRIPLFHGIGSAHVTPADLLLLMLIVFWMLKRGTSETAPLERTPLRSAVFALLAAVVLGVVIGIAHHGQVRVAMMEVRPYAYIGATYLLATVLLTSREAIRMIPWAFVIASGFKAGQGILLFIQVRHLRPRPEALLGHEEAFFFGLFVFLTIGLWLFRIPGRLRTTATFLLPVVLAADLVNGRRTAWLIIFAGLVALLVVGGVCLPERRRFLRRLLVVVAVFSVLYFPAYWNHTGGLAQPARAVRSVISPDPRDASSNLYRRQEDANLKFNIRQSPVVGRGFGVPIDYALPITNISTIDPLIAYVPHNGVLYIFMRMGVFGAIAFWSLLGVGIITGCRLARERRGETALFGALIVCALMTYAVEGYNDQGFFFYRIAFIVGSLLGIGQAAHRLNRSGEAQEASA